MSFFDEDEEPARTTTRTRTRTRPRPRRGSPAGGGRGGGADQQQVLIRRMVGVIAIAAIILLFGVLIKACSSSRHKSALEDYNRQVNNIATASAQTGTEFFRALDGAANQSPEDLQQSISSFKVNAEQQLKQAQDLSVPGEMESAQQSALIALELRRDGLAKVAGEIRTALGDQGEAADAAIKDMAGQMMAFNSSDVLWDARVIPFMKDALTKGDVNGPTIQKSQFLSEISWISDAYIAPEARAAALDRERDEQEPADRPGPARHGAQRHLLRQRDPAAGRDEPADLREGPAVHGLLHQPGRQRRVQRQGHAEARPRHGFADHHQQDRAEGGQGREGNGRAPAQQPAAAGHRGDRQRDRGRRPGRDQDGQQQVELPDAVRERVAAPAYPFAVTQFSDAPGIVALAAAATASLALIVAVVLAFRVRRLRGAQRRRLGGHQGGPHRPRQRPAGAFEALHTRVEEVAERLDERMAAAEDRLDGAIAYRALVRYDAYGEMSGHQSTSLALLDADHNGVVLSSIAHRDTARLYCKQVHGGRGEHQLSPEEEEAVRRALAGEVGSLILGE